MLTFEEAAKRWAAAKYDLDLDVIKSVDFDLSVGGGCPTCGPELDLDITVWFSGGGLPHTDHSMNPYDFGALMRDLFAAGVTEVTQ